MEIFNFTVDVLSALASLIAIVAVLIAWYMSLRKPLKISRVVIHQKGEEESDRYILIVRNFKPYPVTIKSIRCFTHEVYQVEKKSGDPAEFHSSLSLGNCLFVSTEDNEIPPSGNTNIRFDGAKLEQSVSSLIFSIESSHGIFNLKCRKIVQIEIGAPRVYQVEFSETYTSYLEAKYQYYLLKLREKLNL